VIMFSIVFWKGIHEGIGVVCIRMCKLCAVYNFSRSCVD